MVLDPEGRIIAFNRGCEEFSGYLAPEVRGRRFWDVLLPPEQRERVAAGFKRMCASGDVVRGENVWVARDGTRRQMIWHGIVVRDESGAVRHVVATGVDITEERHAECALRDSERYFRSLIENAHDVITITDAEGVIRYESPAVERAFGYRPEELIGKNAFDLIHPDDRAAVLDAFEKCVRDPAISERIRLRFMHKNGSWRVLEAVGHNLLGDPAVGGMVSNLRDITEHCHAEEALREREDQLRQAQKMDAVGRLAGGVAHDFNNMLTAILGYSETMLHGLAPGDPMQQRAGEIKKAAERAAALTRQLLAFSRKQVLSPRVLDLNAVLADMLPMLRRLIGEDIELAIRTDPDLGQVRADPGQLEQVVMNLVINARDAMPRGGRLLLTTANRDQTCPEIQDRVPCVPCVLLEVRDSGIGMDPETCGRIFEPFFTTKDKGKGTGLGLATVYGIVQQSGGFISVESLPGEGSTFRIFLPRVEQPADRRSEPNDGVPVAHGGETVLLAEDEELVRRLLCDVLACAGYRVLQARDGPAALELDQAHRGPVHLLLTDVVMPGINGRELADRLRLRRPRLRVLYISGYADDAISRHGALEPGTAFLQKPFTPEVVVRKVREVLEATVAV
jgi:two-component system cell cycle sensor histidine kinase/response regulator CckA